MDGVNTMAPKELCPKCGSVDFGILRDMTSRRVCKCSHTWAAPEKFAFSKLRQELEKASLDIIRSRQYRGARESDYRAWLCDYVEHNFIAKSDYDALKAKLERANKLIKEFDPDDCFTFEKGSEELEESVREYLKGEE